MEWIKEFNNNYANTVMAATPFIIAITSWLFYKLYHESKLNEGDAANIVKPCFWSFGEQYKILAVHKFEKSDHVSGYNHISQNSRPDQWAQFIQIKSSLLGFRYTVVPNNCDDILRVIISRNGKETWKSIHFNN